MENAARAPGGTSSYYISIIVETLVIDVMENGQSSEPKERLAKTLESYEECPQYKDQRSEKH